MSATTTAEKQCPGCMLTKPLKSFSPNEALIDGHSVVCRSCEKKVDAGNRPSGAATAYYSEGEGSPLFRAYRDPELHGRFVGVKVGDIALCLVNQDVRAYGEERSNVKSGVDALLANEAVRREVEGKSVAQVAELIVAGSPADQAAAGRAYAERQRREAAPAPMGDVARYAEAIECEREERAYAERVAEHRVEELREYAEVERQWGLLASSVGISPLELPPPALPAPRDLRAYQDEEQREQDERWAREQIEKLKAAEAEKAWPEVEKWIVQP